jgi:phthiocerol/phenolphthiocerol synthesis type-I polyketide synthase E
VRPAAMIGHSLGEYVAACLAGVLTLEDALTLVAWRGRLMQALPPGAMLAVALDESELTPLLGEGLSLAAVNGERACVVAGAEGLVEELAARLGAGGTACRRLQTSHAFHSRMMDAALAPFAEQVRRVKLRAPQIPYVSNLTGTWVTEREATDADYWVRQLRQTVRFADGLAGLLKEPNHVLLEVGPGQTLAPLAQRHPAKSDEHFVLSSLQRPRDGQSDEEDLLRALGQLWLAGVEVDWNGFYARERRQRLALPTYPFERQRHWIERPQTSETGDAPGATDVPAATDVAGAAQASSPAESMPEAAAVAAIAASDSQAATFTHEAAESGSGADAPAAAGNVTTRDGARQRVVAQQLELMSRQLEVLRQRRARVGGTGGGGERPLA